MDERYTSASRSFWMISSVWNRLRGMSCLLRWNRYQSLPLWNWSRLRRTGHQEGAGPKGQRYRLTPLHALRWVLKPIRGKNAKGDLSLKRLARNQKSRKRSTSWVNSAIMSSRKTRMEKLQCTACRTFLLIVDSLTKHGADPLIWRQKTKHGWTPEMIASGKRSEFIQAVTRDYPCNSSGFDK